MKIKQVLNDGATSVASLAHRLQVQLGATRTPQAIKKELKEWIADLAQLQSALNMIGEAYGPIMQSAVDVGMAGYSHRVAVEVLKPAPTDGPNDGFPEWIEISEHIFTLENTTEH